MIARSGATAILMVTAGATGATVAQTPGTTTTTTHVVPVPGTTVYQGGKATTYGGGTTTSVTTATTPGLTIRYPFAKYRADMFDVKTGKQTWFASLESKGDAFTDQVDLVQNMVKTVVQQLREDGVVGER